MSRIDEALKRVGAAGKVPADAPVVVAVPPRFDGSLEKYASEIPETAQKGTVANAQVRLRPVGTTHATRPVQPSVRPLAPIVLDGKLVASGQLSPSSIEQYRRLAATLHDLQEQRQVKSLMVSSALPREGKTLTVTNLALTLNESYHQRVLLIDADLRRPSIHELFGVPSGNGLADALTMTSGTLPLVEISPRLSVLTAGYHDGVSPLAQLTSPRFPDIIDQATHLFDWVLVDTPPIGLLPDAQHVARVCDGVIFVIGAGSTPYRVIQRSIAELGRDRIVGTLLNRVESRSLSVREYGDYYPSESHSVSNQSND
jgi:capsular exopolysaccharide synthesis family protein